MINLNLLELCVIYVVGTVAASVVGLLLVRRFVPVDRIKPLNEVAGFLIAIVGVVYAVLLGFVVLVVWEQYDTADLHATQEANAVTSAYLLAHIYPPAERTRVRGDLHAYAKSVIAEEWPTMAYGKPNPSTQRAMNKTWETVMEAYPDQKYNASLYPALINRLTDISNYRSFRLVDSEAGVPPLMWTVLIIGGAITIGFTYFFATEALKPQIVMTVLVSTMIGLILFMIAMINGPFDGYMRVESTSMSLAMEEMQQIDAGDTDEIAPPKIVPASPR